MSAFEGKTYPEKAGLEGPRYRVHFSPRLDHWVIVDELRIPPDVSLNEELPEGAKVELPVEAVRGLVKEVADTKQIDSILADQKYEPKEKDRHLDIIEDMLEQLDGKVDKDVLEMLAECAET